MGKKFWQRGGEFEDLSFLGEIFESVFGPNKSDEEGPSQTPNLFLIEGFKSSHTKVKEVIYFDPSAEASDLTTDSMILKTVMTSEQIRSLFGLMRLPQTIQFHKINLK